MVVFSLSVPPADLLLCAAMLALASLGLALTFRGRLTWRRIWTSALVVATICGTLEIVAGRRIAAQRAQAFPEAQPISTVRTNH